MLTTKQLTQLSIVQKTLWENGGQDDLVSMRLLQETGTSFLARTAQQLYCRVRSILEP